MKFTEKLIKLRSIDVKSTIEIVKRLSSAFEDTFED